MKPYNYLTSVLALLVFLIGRCNAQDDNATLTWELTRKDSPAKDTIPLSELAKKVFEERPVDLASATAKPVEDELNVLREECLEMLKNGQEPQKRVAARLLGILRSEKAIDLLIANITLANPLQFGSGVRGIEGIPDYPACAALLGISGPNVLSAVRKARSSAVEGSLEQRLFTRIINTLTPQG
jgi:hypothetical protein